MTFGTTLVYFRHWFHTNALDNAFSFFALVSVRYSLMNTRTCHFFTSLLQASTADMYNVLKFRRHYAWVLSDSGVEYTQFMNNKLCPFKVCVSLSSFSGVWISAGSFQHAVTPDDVNTGHYLQSLSPGDCLLSFTNNTAACADAALVLLKSPYRNERAIGWSDECWQIGILPCWRHILCASCHITFGGLSRLRKTHPLWGTGKVENTISKSVFV